MLPHWCALAMQVLSLASPVLEFEFTMGNFTQPCFVSCSSFPSLFLPCFLLPPKPRKQQTIKCSNSGSSYTHCCVLAAKSHVQGFSHPLGLCCITPYELQEEELRITPCRISLVCCDSSGLLLLLWKYIFFKFSCKLYSMIEIIRINLFIQLLVHTNRGD